MKVLITGGGTVEKIDDMRTISNASTGRTAFELAKSLMPENDVTLLMSSNSSYYSSEIKTYNFKSVEDLYQKTIDLVPNNYDLIIHAAAIGDYTVASIESSQNFNEKKIPSGIKDLILKLKPTRKIINEFQSHYPNAFLVGFKLSPTVAIEEVQNSVDKIFMNSGADLVVQNFIDVRKRGDDLFSVYENKTDFKEIKNISDLSKYIIKKYERRSQ